MFKKVLNLLAALFLCWSSIHLLSDIPNMNVSNKWFNLFIAFLVNLYVLGAFAFAGFALPTQRLLSDGYYYIHRPRMLESFYKGFKVDMFRQFLLLTFWRNKNQQKKYFDGTKQGIENLVVQSQKSEFGHLIPFVLITAFSFFLLWKGRYVFVFWAMLINVFANFYPILLQRFHRMRIQRLGKIRR